MFGKGAELRLASIVTDGPASARPQIVNFFHGSQGRFGGGQRHQSTRGAPAPDINTTLANAGRPIFTAVRERTDQGIEFRACQAHHGRQARSCQRASCSKITAFNPIIKNFHVNNDFILRDRAELWQKGENSCSSGTPRMHNDSLQTCAAQKPRCDAEIDMCRVLAPNMIPCDAPASDCTSVDDIVRMIADLPLEGIRPRSDTPCSGFGDHQIGVEHAKSAPLHPSAAASLIRHPIKRLRNEP